MTASAVSKSDLFLKRLFKLLYVSKELNKNDAYSSRNNKTCIKYILIEKETKALKTHLKQKHKTASDTMEGKRKQSVLWLDDMTDYDADSNKKHS